MKFRITAAALLLALSAAAEATVSSQSGDLILAFRDTSNGVPFNLEVDLGPVANFLSLPAGTQVSLNLGGVFFGSTRGLSAQDLRNVYGDGSTNSSWNSLSTLKFNVFATNGAAGNNTLYLTAPEGSILTRSSSAGQSSVAGRINTITSTLNGSASLVSPQSASIAASAAGGSYSAQYHGGNPGTLTLDWNKYGVVTETAVPASGSAAAGFYNVAAGSGAADEIGKFQLDSNGNLSYLAIVPEPASGVLLLTGAVLAMGRRRRRAVVAQ